MSDLFVTREKNYNLKKFQALESLHILRKRCPYSELFWSVFSSIRTEYGKIDAPHFFVFSPNAGKYGPEKLRRLILFTQWQKTVKTWDINYFLQGTSNIEPDPGNISKKGRSSHRRCSARKGVLRN